MVILSPSIRIRSTTWEFIHSTASLLEFWKDSEPSTIKYISTGITRLDSALSQGESPIIIIKVKKNRKYIFRIVYSITFL
jgi:hypothetical protein